MVNHFGLKMEKLHMCKILFLLLSWTTLATQHPITNDLSTFDASAHAHEAQPAPIWVSYDDEPIAAANSGSRIAEQIAGTNQWLRKRGFSMLARWKPFNTLSKQRTSIRNIHANRHLPPSAAVDFELLSAETRAYTRPSGQPLRWG